MKFERLAIIGIVVVAGLVGIGFYAGLLTGPAGALLGSASGIDVPGLDDPAMIRRGAAHYDRFCARCHASPTSPEQAADLKLSPSPPKLYRRLGELPAEVLFVKVKHGVPGTGMPAWPSPERDDEIWAMVAFLLALPELEPESYLRLASLPVPAELAIPVRECARCHGADGRGAPDGAAPRLDIQSPEYLLQALLAFKEGRRQSGIMQSAIAGLGSDELARLAQHFGRRVIVPNAATPPAVDGVACNACHGPPRPARAEYPSLAGQYRGYLTSQFGMLADPEASRGGGEHVHVMQRAAHLASGPAARAWLEWYGMD